MESKNSVEGKSNQKLNIRRDNHPKKMGLTLSANLLISLMGRRGLKPQTR
jgi:hypothetical protein